MKRLFPCIILLVTAALASCKSTRGSGSNLNEVASNAGDSTKPASNQNPKKYSMTIEGPFKTLIYSRREDIYDPETHSFKGTYQDAKITFEGSTFNGSLRLRGGISFCGGFPQLKMKLPKDRLIEGQREFKVKTHGVYTIDPKIPVDAPSCGNEFWNGENQRELFAKENMLYDLSAALLDYHLNNLKFDVRYVDPSIQLDAVEKAYFIEDAGEAAKRYGMKSREFLGMDYAASWRGPSDEELIESIVGEMGGAKLKVAYNELKKKKPDATEEELGKEIQTLAESIMQDEGLKKEAESVKEGVVKSRKEKQLALLRRFDTKSLAQAILFELMIDNSDWNIFGVTTHDDPVKNIEIFESANQTLYVVPYDFDLSNIIGNSSFLTSDFYSKKLLAFKASMQKDLDGIVLPAIKTHAPEFIRRLEAVQESNSWDATVKAKMAIYAQALKDFAAGL